MRREIARQTHGYSRIGINRYEICKMDTFTFRSRGGSFFSFFFFLFRLFCFKFSNVTFKGRMVKLLIA